MKSSIWATCSFHLSLLSLSGVWNYALTECMLDCGCCQIYWFMPSLLWTIDNGSATRGHGGHLPPNFFLPHPKIINNVLKIAQIWHFSCIFYNFPPCPKNFSFPSLPPKCWCWHRHWPLIKLITVQSLWHIIIWNRSMLAPSLTTDRIDHSTTKPMTYHNLEQVYQAKAWTIIQWLTCTLVSEHIKGGSKIHNKDSWGKMIIPQ